jgi:hypothetical protein
MFHNPLKALRVTIVVVDIAPKIEEMKVKEASETKKEEAFILSPLNHKQLAQMYGESWFTFQKWIKKLEKEVGKKTGHFYHVPLERKIIQLIGIP